MQKVVAILEKNAEWIALGLAGLWVFWIVWAYGVNKPVSVEVDRTVCTPANIDEYVRETVARRLQERIVDPKTPTIEIKVPDLVLNNQVPPSLLFSPILSLPAPKNTDTTPGAIAATNLLNALPDVPVAKIQAVQQGRSQIVPPPAPRVAGADGAMPPPRGVQPGQPVVGIDKSWVKVVALFNAKELDAEFTKAKIPASLDEIVYLEVQLQRQEVGLDGAPIGQPTPVPPLTINVPPTDRKLQPAQFVDWVAKPETQQEVLQPKFYPVVGADPSNPGVKLAVTTPVKSPAQLAAEAGAALLTQLKALKTPVEQRDFRSSLTIEQRKLLTMAETAEKEKAAAAAAKIKTTTKPPKATKAPRATGYGGDAQDPALFAGVMLAQARGGEDALPPPALLRGGGRGGARPGAAQLPTGPLTPDADGNITIWAYDDAADPGKIFQYRIRVIVKNPVYGTDKVASPALTQILDLPVKENWSEWSKPVSLSANLKIQVVGNVMGRDQVKVNVYRWANGKNNKSPAPFLVGPGDMVGNTSGEVDFSTDWMVADVRQVGNDTRVTLVNIRDSQTQVRYLKTDSINPEYKDEPEPPTVKPAIGAMPPGMTMPQ